MVTKYKAYVIISVCRFKRPYLYMGTGGGERCPSEQISFLPHGKFLEEKDKMERIIVHLFGGGF